MRLAGTPSRDPGDRLGRAALYSRTSKLNILA